MSLAVIAMLYYSESQLAQMALIIGLALLFLFPTNLKVSKFALLTFIPIILLTSPYIALSLFDTLTSADLEVAILKNGYANNRAEIWDFIARRILETPLIGYGIETTKLTSFDHAHLYHNEDTVLHPHNFALQIWMEFGVLGALISSALFSLTTFKILQAPKAVKPYIVAIYIALIFVAAISYGMWQSWWIGSIIYICTLCIIIMRHAESSLQEKQ